MCGVIEVREHTMSLHLGARAHLVIASDVDEREKAALTTDLQECLGALLGGRTTARYSPEIALMASLCFYTAALAHSDHRPATPGQDYAALSLLTHRGLGR